MVATDTVVGIVGAVVLVGVMAAVFVYEYNNAPESDVGLSEAEFRERYPGLGPGDDIDGDGTANLDDADMDGDDQPNGEDADQTVTFSFSKEIGPQAGPAATGNASFAFDVGRGNAHLEAYLNYTTVLPAPAPPVPAFQLLLQDGDGVEQAVGTSSQSDTAVTVSVATGSPLAVGGYTFEVTQGDAGPGGNVALVVLIHYGEHAQA